MVYISGMTQRGSLATTAAAATSVMARPTWAAQSHRFDHGEFDITVLSDGFLTLSADVLLPDASPEERNPILTSLGGDLTGAPVQANVPLIRYGNDLIHRQRCRS